MPNDLITIIKSLNDSTTNIVLLNNQTGTSFNTTVGVRQGCLLSPFLFNIFLERIIHDSLSNQKSGIEIRDEQLTIF